MYHFFKRYTVAFFVFFAPLMATAGDSVLEDFKSQPETRWGFFTDGVMGGVSLGQASFVAENDDVHAHMTGNVSTENNGGFIQIRMKLPDGAPKDAKGVRLVVRGNNQEYFVHLRTSGTRLPWQYYQAGFDVSNDWKEVMLPFTDFKPSGSFLRAVPRASSLKSIGVVAFGRDHEAEVDIKEIGFY